ncbi:MAG: DUF2062 domain-containing protein [Vicinamibacteria bacterium]
MLGWLLRRLRVLLQVEDSPRRVALSFAIGVFVSFSPFLGIHTGMSLAIAFVFRLNRVAILIGTWVNNPWTIAPVYTAGTLLGCALLGVSPASLGEIDWALHGRAFYAALLEGFRPLLVPFFVGNTIVAAVAAVVTYLVALRVLARRRASAPRSAA